MRHVCHGFVALALLSLLGSPALAQRGGRGGFGGGPGMLLLNESVQKELKLTDDQIAKSKDAAKKIADKNREEFAKLRDLSREERTKKMQELMTSSSEEMTKELAAFLNPDQMKRLKQITIQQEGSRAFSNPEVAKELKLTDEQKSKIKSISDDASKAMRDLFQPGGAQGNREDARKKMAELRKDTMDKISAVLTDDQKTAWKDMQGEPFEVKFQPRRGQ